jgi:hypothetical protein
LILGDGGRFEIQMVRDDIHRAERSNQLVVKDVCFQHFELLGYGVSLMEHGGLFLAEVYF